MWAATSAPLAAVRGCVGAGQEAPWHSTRCVVPLAPHPSFLLPCPFIAPAAAVPFAAPPHLLLCLSHASSLLPLSAAAAPARSPAGTPTVRPGLPPRSRPTPLCASTWSCWTSSPSKRRCDTRAKARRARAMQHVRGARSVCAHALAPTGAAPPPSAAPGAGAREGGGVAVCVGRMHVRTLMLHVPPLRVAGCGAIPCVQGVGNEHGRACDLGQWVQGPWQCSCEGKGRCRRPGPLRIGGVLARCFRTLSARCRCARAVAPSTQARLPATMRLREGAARCPSQHCIGRLPWTVRKS